MWMKCYKTLVTLRRALNVLIDWTRAKAYPATGGKRNRKIAATVQELRDNGAA